MSLEASTKEMDQAFRKAARELAQEFRTVADNLDENLKNVRIARITGSSVSAVGGVGALVGLGLAFFTAGISLIPAAVAAGVSAAGGVTATGAEIVGSILKKNEMEEMEKKWQNFQKLYNQCFPQDEPKGLGSDKSKHLYVKDTMNTRNAGLKMARIHAKTAWGCGKEGAKALKVAGAAARGEATAATAATRGVALGVSKFGIVLNVVGVGISVYDIVTAAVDLHDEKKCPAGDFLRMLADELDKLAEN